MRFSHGSHVAALAALLFVVPVAGKAADQPHRIVSAFLCTDEYVFRLVPRERIAALSYLAADTHPVVSTIADRVKGIPLVHETAEEVLSLHPDLVVTYAGTAVKMQQQLRRVGVPVLEVPWAQSLADVRRITRMLGNRFDESERANGLLTEMDTRLADAKRKAASPPVRTLVYEANGYVTAGGVSDEILSAAGLQNMAPRLSLTRSGTLPVESVLTVSPELLILNDNGRLPPARANLVLSHPALAALRGHALVTRFALTPLLCPGPWSVDVAAPLAGLGRQARALATRAPAP